MNGTIVNSVSSTPSAEPPRSRFASQSPISLLVDSLKNRLLFAVPKKGEWVSERSERNSPSAARTKRERSEHSFERKGRPTLECVLGRARLQQSTVERSENISSLPLCLPSRLAVLPSSRAFHIQSFPQANNPPSPRPTPRKVRRVARRRRHQV